MRRDVGKVADMVIMIDTGCSVDQRVAADPGVRLDDGAVQNHGTFTNAGRRGYDGRTVVGDSPTHFQHFGQFSPLRVPSNAQYYRTIEGGKLLFGHQPDAGLDVRVRRVPALGPVVKNALDFDPLAFENIDDDMRVPAGTVYVIRFGKRHSAWVAFGREFCR